MLWTRVVLMAGLVAGISWAQVRPANSVNVAPASGSYLGIWIWEVDAVRAKDLRLPEAGSVEVTLVRPGSPADAAGVKAGDIITEYDGQRVEGSEHFSRLVRETPAGRSVKLRIIHNGTPQVVVARIDAISPTDRPGPVSAGRAPQLQGQDVPRSMMTWRSPMLGVDAEPLFGQLAEYFGVTEGVLVRAVAAGSPAEKAGLRAGDVITRVGKSAVATPAEITARLRAQTSRSVPLVIMRERKETAIIVTLE
jgi:serine protease Do